MCVFGTSGAGKSYYIKLNILRYRLFGIEQYVIDPEREYTGLCNKLEGTLLKLGPNSETYINVFDIRKESIEKGEKGFLANKIIKLIGFFNLVFGELDEEEKGLIEEKIIQTYEKKNINFDDKSLYKNNENKKAGAGEICGYMQNNTKVKVVGISARKGESGIPANIISKKDNINTAPSLCIYADYNGSCLDEPAANKEASTISSDSNVDDMGAYPYVTVNPKNVIDKTADSPKFLTGDGADKSAVEAIIADISKGIGYINAADEYNDVFQKYEGKLTTFNEKTGASVPDDFSVLLINESNYRKITEMLNSFIHILTNDTSISSYAQTGSSVFSVDIMPMRLNETSGTFESGENFTKTLEYKNGYFRMTNMDYDSNYPDRHSVS